MANRTYLYNTERLVLNPYLVLDPGPDGGGKAVMVAEDARRIPVPWLCAFRPEDAHPFTHRLLEDEEDPNSPFQVIEGHGLSAPLSRVLDNLRAALPVYEKVLGVPQLARAYLDDALKAFSTLELPYVVLDAEEVVDGDYARLLASLDGSDAAVAHLKEWSGYEGESFWQAGMRVPQVRDETGLWCGFGPETTVPLGDEPGSLDLEARPWLQAAEGGDAEAQFRIGLLFKESGESASRDDAARDWLRRAAQQGHVEAQLHLAEMVEGAESLDWLTRAAKAGHAQAQANLAARYSMQGEHRLAIAWLTRAAENGHAHAAYTLARVHQGSQPGVLDVLVVQYLGPGQHVYDPEKSLFWLRKAIDAGFREGGALRMLGELSFRSGNLANAARSFRQAADAGDDKAQLWLGVLYYHGFGVGRDRAAAARWTRKSVDNGGSSEALYALAILYDRGEGVPRDQDEGRRWMEKAAARGYPLAIQYLSRPGWRFWARQPGFPESLA